MQTSEPRKRTNWIFVAVLVIAIPLLFFVLFMLNTIPEDSPSNTSQIDSVKTKNTPGNADGFKKDSTITKNRKEN